MILFFFFPKKLCYHCLFSLCFLERSQDSASLNTTCSANPYGFEQQYYLLLSQTGQISTPNLPTHCRTQTRVKTNLIGRDCYGTWRISLRCHFISLCSKDSLHSFQRLYCLPVWLSACHSFLSFSPPLSPQFLNVSQFQLFLTQR